MEPEPITVRDVAGQRVAAELIDRETDGSLLLRGPDGRRWLVPADAIERREGADIHLAVDLADLQAGRASATEDDRAESERIEGSREVVPLVEEQLVVETRTRPTATVRVSTRTHEREETIDEVLSSETVNVARVPIDRYVETPASVRVEGDVTIVPVHEEVLFVEKRLLLKEELHLTKRKADRHETQRVTLRHQTADIERLETED
jgi:stress response protein YsnF